MPPRRLERGGRSLERAAGRPSAEDDAAGRTRESSTGSPAVAEQTRTPFHLRSGEAAFGWPMSRGRRVRSVGRARVGIGSRGPLATARTGCALPYSAPTTAWSRRQVSARRGGVRCVGRCHCHGRGRGAGRRGAVDGRGGVRVGQLAARLRVGRHPPRGARRSPQSRRGAARARRDPATGLPPALARLLWLLAPDARTHTPEMSLGLTRDGAAAFRPRGLRRCRSRPARRTRWWPERTPASARVAAVVVVTMIALGSWETWVRGWAARRGAEPRSGSSPGVPWRWR